MKVSSRKNQKLLRQFPFIKDILRQEMEPYRVDSSDEKGSRHVDELTITVQRADGDLLFRQANNAGLGDSSAIFILNKAHKDQIMKQGEHLFAIDREDRIINRVIWPRNRTSARSKPAVYGKKVLWGTSEGNFLSNPIHDKITHLVWVTVCTWHKDTGNDTAPEGRFGECLKRIMHITVYGPPHDSSFKKLETESSVWINLCLNQDVLTRALCEKDIELLQMYGCLWELCKLFQDEVWDAGMKQMYEGFETRGALGQFGTAEVLVAEMCGYYRAMFKNSTCWISFQLRPGGIDMYVLGQNGTLPQIRRLVRDMVKMWITNPKCHANFKASEDVSVV